MVNSAMFTPNENDLACLGRIHGQARVLRQHFKDEILNRVLNRVLIVADDGTGVCVHSDYGDVEFKFECFFLNVLPYALDSGADTVEICEVEGWHSLKCVFGYEYERPAAKGEVPESWEQVVRKRGNQSEIPKEATAIGCALVGIVFWNSVDCCPVLLVANDDVDGDDPTSLQVCKEKGMIESFINTYEVVNLEDVSSWTREARVRLSALHKH